MVTTVFPFILRGVSLLGVDSVQLDMDSRREVWERLGKDFPVSYFEKTPTQVASLSDLDRFADDIINGRVAGRVLVDVSKL